MPYCWSEGGWVAGGCDHDHELGGAVGLALCHCVAGPGMGGALGGMPADCGVPGSGGALTVGGWAMPGWAGGHAPYGAGWPIIPVAGGVTVVA